MPKTLRKRLATWYQASRRDLPWRRTRDPWAIWVSEVMLQQTRVETVLPRFEEFLRAFPDPAALARAPEERVLSLWSGLGYYARARALRRGAGVVLERHDGLFPRTWTEARSLPGVGDYTAAAVLSIAYGAPHAVVDGNVARVLARLLRLEPPDDRPGTALQRLAGALIDAKRPGDHNQAMMELGALICRPRAPRCVECPLAGCCRAHQEGVVELYPRARPRPAPIAREERLYLLRDRAGRLLLERGVWPLLPHLWLPPIRPAGEALSLPPALRIAAGRLHPLGSFRHSITRHRVRFEVCSAVVRPGRAVLPDQYRWVEVGGLSGIGRSSIVEKALALEQAVRRGANAGERR